MPRLEKLFPETDIISKRNDTMVSFSMIVLLLLFGYIAVQFSRRSHEEGFKKRESELDWSRHSKRRLEDEKTSTDRGFMNTDRGITNTLLTWFIIYFVFHLIFSSSSPLNE